MKVLFEVAGSDSHLALKFRPSSRDWSLTYARPLFSFANRLRRAQYTLPDHLLSSRDYRWLLLRVLNSRSKVLAKELNCFRLCRSLVSQKWIVQCRHFIHCVDHFTIVLARFERPKMYLGVFIILYMYRVINIHLNWNLKRIFYWNIWLNIIENASSIAIKYCIKFYFTRQIF